MISDGTSVKITLHSGKMITLRWDADATVYEFEALNENGKNNTATHTAAPTPTIPASEPEPFSIISWHTADAAATIFYHVYAYAA